MNQLNDFAQTLVGENIEQVLRVKLGRGSPTSTTSMTPAQGTLNGLLSYPTSNPGAVHLRRFLLTHRRGPAGAGLPARRGLP